MQTREDIFVALKQWMVDLFEIDPDKITMDAHLYEDLDIDSIDAVDLVVKIREITGKQIQAEEFKHVRRISDVVDAIAKLNWSHPDTCNTPYPSKSCWW